MADDTKKAGDNLKAGALEYHRQPKMTFLSFDDPFALTREDFVRLGQATQPDDGRPLPYSEEVMSEFERTSCYDRFWVPGRRSENASTRVICTGPSMVMVGMHGLSGYSDPQNGDDEPAIRAVRSRDVNLRLARRRRGCCRPR